MPIKPENKARYPQDWPAIRRVILNRAGHRCEQCGILNYTWIIRGHGPDAGTFRVADSGAVHDAESGARLGDAKSGEYTGHPRTRVILTIAHLDHTPEHNDPANLRALCCRCHLLHDAPHHRQTAYRTRHARKALGDLFDPPAPP